MFPAFVRNMPLHYLNTKKYQTETTSVGFFCFFLLKTKQTSGGISKHLSVNGENGSFRSHRQVFGLFSRSNTPLSDKCGPLFWMLEETQNFSLVSAPDVEKLRFC